MWGWISYDPELNLIYYGTGNPGPWNPDQRPGDNKWTCGIFARDADTGEARLVLPDRARTTCYDYDGINENVLLDLDDRRPAAQGAGAPRAQRLRLRPRPRDRRGALGRPVRATSTRRTGVDLKTGRLIDVPDEEDRRRQGRARHLPGRAGRQGLAAVGLLAAHRAALHPAQQPLHGLRGGRGELHRRHAVRGREREDVRRARAATAASSPPGIRSAAQAVWKIKENSRSGAAPWSPPATWSSTARWTAGSRRSTPRTGQELWKFKTGSGIIGQPITYRGPDGKQYVAVLSGVGGWAGAIVAGELDPRDGTAALGFVERHDGPAAVHHHGRACCMSSRCPE